MNNTFWAWPGYFCQEWLWSPTGDLHEIVSPMVTTWTGCFLILGILFKELKKHKQMERVQGLYSKFCTAKKQWMRRCKVMVGLSSVDPRRGRRSCDLSVK